MIYAVRDRKYDNANLLNPWNHTHKHSINSFFDLLSDFFAESIEPVGKVGIKLGSVADPNRLKIYIPMIVNGEEKYAIPDPPLNLNVKVGGKPISFKRQTDKLAKLANLKNVKQIEKYISNKANERNKLLYAAAHGYPHHFESVKNDFFFYQKQKVMKMVYVYLLIEPYKEKQPFVQQAIDSLLKMLGKIESAHLNDQI